MRTETDTPHRQIGRLIKSLRLKKGLTGAELAKKILLSQSKISKIENGYSAKLNKELVARLLQVLEADDDAKARVNLLLQKAGERLDHMYTFDYESGSYINLLRQAHQVYVLTINIVPALLQTAAYRAASLQHMGLHDEVLKQAMQESLQRQDLLWTAGTDYRFLLHESALYTMPTDRAAHLAQLDRLERMLQLPGVDLAILPAQAGLSMVEPCNFAIYNQQLVARSIGPSEVITKDSELVGQYLELFHELSDKSYRGPAARELLRQAANHLSVPGE